MDIFVRIIEKINGALNNFLWGPFGLFLIIGTGAFFTARLRGFQITEVKGWLFDTAKAFLKRRGDGVSPFSALCTALAATVGVGSIVGVASALMLGGPGAVFWMVAASFFSMATAYAENALGAKYATKNKKGERVGGPMYYLKDGFKNRRLGRVLALLFSAFTVFASFGIGNAVQINAIVTNLQRTFPRENGNSSVLIGLVLTVLLGLVILGGIKRIAAVTERIVPFMVVGYIVGALLLIFMNAEKIVPAACSVFRHAFSARSFGGGTLGNALMWGVRRGIFSNEAGLGSTVIANCAAEHKSQREQGFFGVFEVFIDTTVICTVTAFLILCSGLVDLKSGAVLTGALHTTLVSEAFSLCFGEGAGLFVTAALCFFAFSTVVGWSYYGEKAWEFLFGTGAVFVYKAVFVGFTVVGAVVTPSLAFSLSDTANALMMLPNLFGVLALYTEVAPIKLGKREKGKRSQKTI